MRWKILSILVSTLVLSVFVNAGDPFDIIRRGDADNNGIVNFADVEHTYEYLFRGGAAPPCIDAADSNDDGVVNITDVSHTSNWLFQGGPQPPYPGPFNCGPDPSWDTLSCYSSICMDL